VPPPRRHTLIRTAPLVLSFSTGISNLIQNVDLQPYRTTPSSSDHPSLFQFQTPSLSFNALEMSLNADFSLDWQGAPVISLDNTEIELRNSLLTMGDGRSAWDKSKNMQHAHPLVAGDHKLSASVAEGRQKRYARPETEAQLDRRRINVKPPKANNRFGRKGTRACAQCRSRNTKVSPPYLRSY
jgi:hypothetical protein